MLTSIKALKVNPLFRAMCKLMAMFHFIGTLRAPNSNLLQSTLIFYN